jgi:D-lyxose ketol-isomerase
MKRSEINAVIDQAIAFFKKMNFPLPGYAAWPPQGWQAVPDA